MTASAAEPQPSDTPSPSTPRWVRWALGLVLLFTLAVRVWNASIGLDASRFFDERFSLRNVATLLVEGDSRPANAFYGSLSYLPQTFALWISQTLHGWTGIEQLAIFSDRTADGWSPTAYFLCRLVCALFGTWSVYLTYCLGLRLFSARVGLLGAALLSAFPRHILASTEFKPDILVVALVLLTFLWSLDAARHLNRKTFLLAGAGVGMAVAAKYTGVGVAIPLTVGVLWYRLRDRTAWTYLVLAGLASIVTFALLNIHLAVIIEYLPRIWRIMESKGDATGGSRWDVLGIEFGFLVWHHRWPVMLFVLAGVAGMIRRVVSKTTDRWLRLDAVMVLSYVFGYSALYAAATKLFKGQNYLPVAAFTSVLGAWVAVAGWDYLVNRWRPLGRWPVALLLWTLATVWLFEYSSRLLYIEVIPTTTERAQKFLANRLRPLELRHIFYEKEGEEGEKSATLKASTPSGHWLVTLPAENLGEVPELKLDLADAEVFYADRLDGEDSDFYLRRSIRGVGRTVRFDPRLFYATGPPVVVLAHPWKLDGEPTELTISEVVGDDGIAVKNRYQASLEAGGSATTSLALWLPLHTGTTKPRNVTLITGEGQRRELPLYRTRRGGRRAHWITPRFRLEDETLILQFDPALRLDWAPEVRVVRWRAP